jgi:hypothetical protein
MPCQPLFGITTLAGAGTAQYERDERWFGDVEAAFGRRNGNLYSVAKVPPTG